MGAQNIVKEIKQYHLKWLQHVQRMDTNRLPKQALQYKPKGRRNIVRPRKRWRDQLHLEDQGTGNTPNPSGTWWWWWWHNFITSQTTKTISSYTVVIHLYCNTFVSHVRSHIMCTLLALHVAVVKVLYRLSGLSDGQVIQTCNHQGKNKIIYIRVHWNRKLFCCLLI